MRIVRLIGLFVLAALITGSLVFLASGCDEEKNSDYSYLLLLTGGTSLNRIFVTNTAYNGNLGGIAGADAACSNDLNKPAGGSGRWKALIAAAGRTYADSGSWVLKPNTTYYRADGTTEVFTTNASAIFDFSGSFTNSIDAAEMDVWTGMNSDWTNSTDADCSNWTDGTGASNGNTGDTIKTDSGAISISIFTSWNNAYLLCVEQ